MKISQATRDDIDALAKLVWLDTHGEEPTDRALTRFASDLANWWQTRSTHLALVARDGEQAIVGMAWVAMVPRVPRPGSTSRHSADIQTVFVLPEHRGQGLGSALVQAAVHHAAGAGAARVTVQSGRTAVPMYERLGLRSSDRLLQRACD